MRRSPAFQGAKHEFGVSQDPIPPFPLSDYMGDLEGPLQHEKFVFDR